MLIDINKIQVKDRIRQSFGDIEELAVDIKENGLINPPVVTPDFDLIAGERRLRAMQILEYKQVEVRVMAVKDAEHQLNLEISENEIRKDFSKKERIDYARRLERIERVKAEQRIKSGVTDPTKNFTEGSKGETRNIVAQKVGIGSGVQYEKEKFVADNADPDTLAKWDTGNISTHTAYVKIKKEKEAVEDRVKNLEIEKSKLENDVAIAEEKIEELQNTNSGNDDTKEIERLKQTVRQEYEERKKVESELERLRNKPPEVRTVEVESEETEELRLKVVKLEEELLKSKSATTLEFVDFSNAFSDFTTYVESLQDICKESKVDNTRIFVGTIDELENALANLKTIIGGQS